MGWIVTAWRPDAVAAAEREARKIVRSAEREAADVDAYLAELERFALETRADVQRRRTPEPEPQITVRRERASLRESPLAELFRATG